MSKYAVIADSSTDLDKTLREKYPVTTVPFKVTIENNEFIDTIDADTKKLSDIMVKSEDVITSACPSPGDFLDALNKNKQADSIFIQTISSKLSGSFNAATVAKDMFLKENPDKKVHIIDSISASAGNTAQFLKLYELINEGLDFKEIVEKIEIARHKTRALFNSEDFSQLIKNGRMSRVAGNFAQAINLQPIMRDDGEGDIISEKITRGLKGMVKGIVEAIEKYTITQEDKVLIVSHNQAEDKARLIVEKINENYNFKEIHIVPTSVLCTSYVSNRGIIVGFLRD